MVSKRRGLLLNDVKTPICVLRLSASEFKARRTTHDKGMGENVLFICKVNLHGVELVC